MKELFPQFRSLVNAPMIMINGEMLYDQITDSVLTENPLDAKDAAPIAIELLNSFPSLMVTVTDGELFSANDPPLSNTKGAWRMMSLYGEVDAVSRCYDHVCKVYGNDFTIRRPAPHLIDFTKKGRKQGHENTADKGIFPHKRQKRHQALLCRRLR